MQHSIRACPGVSPWPLPVAIKHETLRHCKRQRRCFGDSSPHCSNSRQPQRCSTATAALAAERIAASTSSTAFHPASLQGLLQQEPQLAYVANTLLHGVLLPVLGGWLLVTTLSTAAARARQWCEANPDEPLSLELLGLLPAALENPTRIAVTLFVTTRVLRNIAAGLNGFVETFKPRWNDLAESAARSIVGWLGPFDQTLLKLYTVVAVIATARVLIKWKTIALDFLLRQRAELGRHGEATPGSSKGISGSKSKSKTGASSSSGSGSKSSRRMSEPAETGAGGTRRAFEVVEDDHDEAAVVSREGSMLAVSMRPRSTPAAELTSPSEGSGSGSAAGAAAGSVAAGNVSSGATDQWSLGRGGREDDAFERLLLPLDSILSWAIAVMAGLFAVQTLGLNIQPLLAIGGASSLLIGLATQTLLTNAVMGVSIFLSRPFVPGDSVTVQAAGHIIVSGVVERVTPMRTLLRTDDDVLVTLPNKTIADMVVYNKSRREARSRLTARSWERPLLKFKVKLPQKELHNLQSLKDELKKVLKRPGVAQQSIEIALSKFTDAGAEVLLQCLLLVAVGSPTAQQLLMDLAITVRQHGATLVSIL